MPRDLFVQRELWLDQYQLRTAGPSQKQREREERDRERQRETERQRDREKKERRELAFKSSEPPSPLAPPLKKAKEKTDKRLWTHSALPM